MIASKNSLIKIFEKMSVNLSMIPLDNLQWTEAFLSLGLEVENIISNKLNEQDYAVVKVLKVENHQNSDHLHICKVFDGKNEHQIICGANNVYEGMYTIMAKINTVVPDGFKIEPRKLRGVDSYGMLCSLGELFPAIKPYLISFDNNGIVDLSKQGNKKINFSLIPGANNWIEYLMLNDDIFDLSIPTNAGYLNGLIPIAIALLAYWNIDYSLKSYEIINHNIIHNSLINELGFIKFENFSSNDYKLRMVLAHNMLSANNYSSQKSLLYTHYFGFNFFPLSIKTNINKLTITKLYNSRNILSNSKKYELDKNTLAIISNEEIVAVPNLLVDDKYLPLDNSPFYLFYASNDWYELSKIVNKLNLTNYQAKLATKNTSFYFANNYIKYFFPYISQNNIYVANHIEEKNRFIFLDKQQLFHKLTSFNYLNKNKIINQLRLLQINYDEYNHGFEVPIYRSDLLNDNDLIEEALRMINVNNLKSEPISSFIVNDQDTSIYDNINKIRNYLVGLGFFEVKTYKLISREEFNSINNPFYNNLEQKIVNPISKDKEIIKHSPLISLINILQFNLNQKNYELNNIFEISSLYWKNNNYSNNILSTLIPINIAISEKFSNNSLSLSIIFDLIRNIISLINNHKYLIEFNEVNNFKNYKKIYEVLINKNKVGFIGILNHQLSKNFINNDNELYYFELSIEDLIQYKQENNIFEKFSNLPSISRDININIESDNNFDYLFSKLKNKLYSEFKQIKQINVKSIYHEEKNIVITLNFIIEQYTNLSKEDIDKLDNKIKLNINNIFKM